MNPELISALITIAFGSLAGGLTNTVAIWMLFHPYEPPRFLRWRIGILHGAIPKNQPRLAKAIGRTVGERLLTEEDLTGVLATEEFRSAFAERLHVFIDDVLHTERGSLRELLPESVRPEVDEFAGEIAERWRERVRDWIHSAEFEARIAERAGGMVDAVRQDPVGDILTPEREEAVTRQVDEWLSDMVESESFATSVTAYLDRAAEKLLAPDQTLEGVLPLGLAGSVEKAVAGYLPLAIHRLGGLLEDEDTRARFERTVHDLLERFMQDLKFHQRVVAKLVMTEDTVDRVLNTIEHEGTERLGEMLREPEVQEAMSRGVNDAFVDLLRRPVASVFGGPEDENVREAIRTLTGWIVEMARDPENRTYLIERVRKAVARAGDKTWGDVLRGVPPDRLASWVASAARTEAAERLYADGLHRFAAGILDRPIGVPARWFPVDGQRRLEAALTEPLWGWLQGQVPELVRRVNIAQRVEDKVNQFPTPRMEEIVRRVTDRELKTIVRLGYFLGGMIGLILVVVDHLLPRVFPALGG